MTVRNAGAWGRRRSSVPSTTVKLSDTIPIPVGADAAWLYLQDIKAVAGCIKGLVPDSVEQVSDSTFRGTLRHLALGVPSVWQLEAVVARSDLVRALEIHLEGVEERLDLQLSGDARFAIDGADPATARLSYVGDITVSGRLAGAGGPIIERVVASIIERFVESVGVAGATALEPSWWRRLLRRIGVGWF